MYFRAWCRKIDFWGVASRSEFSLFVLFSHMLLLILALSLGIAVAFGGFDSGLLVELNSGIVALIVVASAMLIAASSFSVRDAAEKGWWTLSGLIPGGALVVFVLTLLPSRRS